MKIFKWETFLGIFTFIFAILICHYTGNRGVFPIDSFSHFDSGYRILNGDHPFRDYWIVSGFLVDYLQSIIFYFLGINWQTYIFNASLINGSVSLLFYLLLNKLGLNFKLSFFYSLCFAILAYPSSGTPFVDHHSALLSVISVIMLIKAMKTNKLFYWSLVPTFLFFSFLSKQVPAAYVFLSVMILTILHLAYQEKKLIIKILTTLVISSLLLISFLVIFLKIYEIDTKLFITQYFYYPNIIGEQRYENLNYDFKNTFLNFKYIYLAVLVLIFFTFENLKKQKILFLKHINFKITLICFLLFLSFGQHIILTKNQIFIFFLIPLLLGFASIQIIGLNKNYLNLFFVILCVIATLKYHYRFNIERKFHELNNVAISEGLNSRQLSKRLVGLKWITPNSLDKKKITEEIVFLKKFVNILKLDQKNKIVLSNYSFFSVLIDENVSGFSRWYPGDNSAFPTKNDKYLEDYKNLVISTIKKRKISSIYVLPDVSEKNLLDYVDVKCFDKFELGSDVVKYKINNKCDDLFVWKKN